VFSSVAGTGGVVYVNGTVCVLDPTPFVTTTLAVPDPAGAMAVMFVGELIVKEVAGTPPKVTPVAYWSAVGVVNS
jgi:hypothetical protein